MAGWYSKVSNDLSHLPDCLEYFEAELVDARSNDLNLKGKALERISAEMPGIVEYRYNQLQEIEAILEHLNASLRKLRSSIFRKFLENHNRALSSRDAEKYVDGEEEVADMAAIVNQFALLRNKWIGLHKGIETKNFQINNIVKLRAAGLDDATIM